MNEKNYDYLKNQIKFTGFGDGHAQELKELIQSGKPEFKIEHKQKFGNDETESTLHFKKSTQSDMYFFNSMEIGVRPKGTDELLKQNYFISNDNNFTLKERYNMLSGRPVHKEFPRLERIQEGDEVKYKPTGETYMAWAELNFKQTDKNGNFLERKLFDFDLDRALSRYPIKELQDNYDKTRLISSLEKGNLQKATLITEEKEIKVLIDANPRDKGVRFYDENNQRLEVNQTQGQKLGQEQTQDKARTLNHKEEQDGTGQNKKQVEKQRKSMKVS